MNTQSIKDALGDMSHTEQLRLLWACVQEVAEESLADKDHDEVASYKEFHADIVRDQSAHDIAEEGFLPFSIIDFNDYNEDN
jgi:hypothetical protein